MWPLYPLPPNPHFMYQLTDRVGHISDELEAFAYLHKHKDKILRVRYTPPSVCFEPAEPGKLPGNLLLDQCAMAVELMPEDDSLEALNRGVIFTQSVSDYLRASGIFGELGIVPQLLDPSNMG